MSDVKAVHEAVRNDLQRRRELAGMTKPDLISHAIWCEARIVELNTIIEEAAQGRAGWRER